MSLTKDTAIVSDGGAEGASPSTQEKEVEESSVMVPNETAGEETEEEESYKLTIKTPNGTVVPVLASSQETVQDLKQAVGETAGTVEYSCFYLSFNGQKLNDFSMLSEIEGLATDSELVLVEDQYTEREARMHVIRLRELLGGSTAVTANPLVAGLDAGVSVFSSVKQSSNTGDYHAFAGFELGKPPSLDALSTTQAIKQLGLPLCIRLLVLSGWNPVPRHQQLKGDLLYLLVTTLENQSYHITAHRTGFYVNASTTSRFSSENYGSAHAGQPGVRDAPHYSAHSLVTLLRRLSPKFARALTDVQRELETRDPTETLPFQLAEQAATPWAVSGADNRSASYDVGGPQEAFLRQGVDSVDSLRDWNEELQSIREMPRDTLQDRVLRDRQLHKWHAEFVEAAVPGAIALVGGELVALNPTDPEDQHMYLRDNIFYSKGFDGREAFADLGGDAAAHVATGKDITGVRLLNQLDAQGLHTLGSVIIDYCGVRVVAQSVVPGVFRRQEVTPIVYGSSDQCVTVSADPEFHRLLEPVAKALHFAEHPVQGTAGGDSVKLHVSADVKGLAGTDGRRYVLDLYRMTPVDVEFLETECTKDDVHPVYPHKLVLLRPELVDIYWERSFRAAVQEHVSEKKTKKSEEKKEENENEEKREEETATKEEEEEKETAATTEETAATNEEKVADLMADFGFSLEFNPDAFTPNLVASNDTSSASTSETAAVRGASQFLRTVSLPSLAHDLAEYISTPLSGLALTMTMHQRGINMRYLGRVADLLPADITSVRNIRRLVLFEMITRATKHILRHLFRLTPSSLHAETFALVANCLVGTQFCAYPAKHLTAAARAIPELSGMTPQTLATEVCAQVALRFRYALPEDFVSTLVSGHELMLLREISVKIGVQLALRQYYFAPPTEAAVHATIVASLDAASAAHMTKPVKRMVKDRVDAVLARQLSIFPDDIMCFVGRTKVATHKSSIADGAFEAGRMALERGDRALGLDLLLESLALHEQTFGVLHSESARCYSVVSLAHYDAGEFELAAEFMTKAVLITERTVGLDDPLTIHNYLNLALYEHARGDSYLALRLMRHAMDLWAIVNAPDHPDLATAYNNIAVMLQSLRRYDDSLRFFDICIDIRQGLLGADHVLVANAKHSMAKVLAVSGNFKAAVMAERDAHRFFSATFGDDDPRSKETSEWLTELTINAVKTAKLSKATKEKIMESANLLRVDHESTAAATTSAAGAGAGAGASATPSSKGHLSIDELIQFINSNSSKSKPRGGPRGKGGPKGSHR